MLVYITEYIKMVIHQRPAALLRPAEPHVASWPTAEGSGMRQRSELWPRERDRRYGPVTVRGPPLTNHVEEEGGT